MLGEVVAQTRKLRGRRRRFHSDRIAVPLIRKRSAEVDGGRVLSRVVREEAFGIDGSLDPVHAEVCCDAIAEFVPNAVGVRFVRKDVNEPRRHDQIGGIDSGLALDVVGRDEGDAGADEANVGDGVVTRCWIHDPTAVDDGVEQCRRRRWLIGRIQLGWSDLFWLFDLDCRCRRARPR